MIGKPTRNRVEADLERKGGMLYQMGGRMVDNENRCPLCLESQETVILKRNSFNAPLTTEPLLAFMNAYCVSPTRGLMLLPEIKHDLHLHIL